MSFWLNWIPSHNVPKFLFLKIWLYFLSFIIEKFRFSTHSKPGKCKVGLSQLKYLKDPSEDLLWNLRVDESCQFCPNTNLVTVLHSRSKRVTSRPVQKHCTSFKDVVRYKPMDFVVGLELKPIIINMVSLYMWKRVLEEEKLIRS